MLTYIENVFGRLFLLSGEMMILFVQSVYGIRHAFTNLRRTLRQMEEIGVNTLPLAVMIGLFTGMVVALQTGTELKELGLEDAVGAIVGLSMVREMGPVITGFIIAGRMGAAMAAELGTMAVTEEVDALRTMGINPVRYLVVPRFFASITMQPLLTIYSIIVGVWGGKVISTSYFRIPENVYYDRLFRAVELDDVVTGLSKTIVFGAIISIVCCYCGLTTKGGAEGVGKSTTRAVVIALTMILVSDYFMTRFFA